jgi:hypothetical protein
MLTLPTLWFLVRMPARFGIDFLVHDLCVVLFLWMPIEFDFPDLPVGSTLELVALTGAAVWMSVLRYPMSRPIACDARLSWRPLLSYVLVFVIALPIGLLSSFLEYDPQSKTVPVFFQYLISIYLGIAIPEVCLDE